MKLKFALIISYFGCLFASLSAYANCSGTEAEVIQCLNTKVSQLESALGDAHINLNALRQQVDTHFQQVNTQIEATETNANTYTDNAIKKTFPDGSLISYIGKETNVDGWIPLDNVSKLVQSIKKNNLGYDSPDVQILGQIYSVFPSLGDYVDQDGQFKPVSMVKYSPIYYHVATPSN